NFGTSAPAGTDMHHLRPTDTDVNSSRGSKDYDNGGSLVNETTDCFTDGDSFEPRDEVKGDCARMMFYMATRYEGDAGGEPDLELVDYTGTSGSNLGKLSTLLAWHIADPVDDWERTRNDRVYSYQHNRNPFIDHPEYVSYIWGGEVPNELGAPVAKSASNIDSTSFTANWSMVTSATGYKLYVSDNSGFTSLLSQYDPKILADTLETITGLTPETDYYYKLKAYDEDSESAFSNVVNLTTLAGGGTVTPPDTGDIHIETFANFPETGSSYINGTFTGQDGSTWSYDQCRGDVQISDETPCLGKGRTPEASITSGAISGGIGTLSFQYKQAYSTGVNLDVYVNDTKVATVISSNETGTIKESGLIDVNVADPLVIKFVQSSGESGQVAIDNVSWTSYPVSIDPVIPNNFWVGDTYPNPFNSSCTLPLELSMDSQTKVALYDLLGNECKILFEGLMRRGYHDIHVNGSDLSTGMYLIKVDHTNGSVLRKVLLIK
ncbi:MAG: endonuclease, partial [Candidatus Marinimicrobia bacterium]|nr:endonuclease [Candidatus Neomarinimicrobiota bacterium]